MIINYLLQAGKLIARVQRLAAFHQLLFLMDLGKKVADWDRSFYTETLIQAEWLMNLLFRLILKLKICLYRWVTLWH